MTVHSGLLRRAWFLADQAVRAACGSRAELSVMHMMANQSLRAGRQVLTTAVFVPFSFVPDPWAWDTQAVTASRNEVT